MDALEIFINEVERQLDKKVKIFRSDRDGEYYGRYQCSVLQWSSAAYEVRICVGCALWCTVDRANQVDP